MASLKNTTINDTGFIQVASGTTAQRPSPANGMTRYNSDTGAIEIYNGATGNWNPLSDNSYSIEIVVIAGGGGGGAGGTISYGGGGGGGAGGHVYVSGITVTKNTSYAIVVGSGGLGAQVTFNDTVYWSSNGSNSTAFGYTAVGGGGGGSFNGGGPNWFGKSGGSGGGSGRDKTDGNGTGTAGQGYNGATAYAGSYSSAGGGGGAGEAGYNGCSDAGGPNWTRSPSTCSCGGIGIAYSWTGSSIYYAGGGSGAYFSNGSEGGAPGGRGFNNGGGNGGSSYSNSYPYIFPTSGLQSRGQGGGGAVGIGASAGAGGSGVVMIRYSGAPLGTGGIVYFTGGFTTHLFTGSGNFIA